VFSEQPEEEGEKSAEEETWEDQQADFLLEQHKQDQLQLQQQQEEEQELHGGRQADWVHNTQVGDQQQEGGQFWGCKVCLCFGGWEISNRRVGSFGL
jgi:hypothetical protein